MKHSKRYLAAVWYLSGKGTQKEAASLFNIKQSTVSQGVSCWKERILSILEANHIFYHYHFEMTACWHIFQ